MHVLPVDVWGYEPGIVRVEEAATALSQLQFASPLFAGAMRGRGSSIGELDTGKAREVPIVSGQ